MELWYSAIAKEDLTNNTICIKDSDGIRNVKHYSEIDTELFVFISNLEPEHEVDSYKRPLYKGTTVRYQKVRI